jgi:hypothetical protein
MSEYRVRSTGDIKSQGQLRRENSNLSFPKVWGANVHEALGIDPVLAAPAPAPSGAYKSVVRNGVVQDANGNWVHAWVERDMFSDRQKHVDADGNEVDSMGHENYAQTVTVTVAEQEAEYQATLDAQAAANVRAQRDRLLADTDFYALSDVTMSAEMTTYRQSLRDITAHANFPNDLEDSDWPTKP